MTVSPTHDRAFMARALELAERGLYTTTPNPRVGCVLVRDGDVVGEGWHERAGEAARRSRARSPMRARAGTTRAARPSTSRSSRATTRAGRRPAPTRCSPPASRASSRRCPIPNPPAAHGAERLRAAGVDVDVGLLERRGARAQPRLRVADDARPAVGAGQDRGEPRRPHGAGERREPVDHRRGGARRRPSLARARLRDPDRHRHRAARRSAAHRARGRDAAPAAAVVVDRHGETPADARVLAGGDVLVVTAATPNAGVAGGRRDARAARRATAAIDLAAMMRALARRGINELHVEAGARLNGALLAAGLVDELLRLPRAVRARRPARAACSRCRRRSTRLADAHAAARSSSVDADRRRSGASSRRSRDADVHRHRAGGRPHRGGDSRRRMALRLARRRRRARRSRRRGRRQRRRQRLLPDGRRDRPARRSRSTSRPRRCAARRGSIGRGDGQPREGAAPRRPARRPSDDRPRRWRGHRSTPTVARVPALAHRRRCATSTRDRRAAELARFIAARARSRSTASASRSTTSRARALHVNLIPHTLAVTTLRRPRRGRAGQPRSRPGRALRRAACVIRALSLTVRRMPRGETTWT